MKVRIYKFVSWEIPALETLKGSKVYGIAEKLNNNEPLSRDEKNWLAGKLSHGINGKWNICLYGWKFDFLNAVKNYVVKQDGSWQEYYAPDKISLRNALYGRIEKIVEVA